MIYNASIEPTENGYRVIQYKQFSCPACQKVLCEINGSSFIRIKCLKCKALWRIEDGRYEMVKPPERIDGDLKNRQQAEIVAIMSGNIEMKGVV